MDLVLDGKGPLYHQVIRSLKAAMASGRIPDGSRLPASRELAHALGVSRTTIVAAYERLRAEGFLVGKVGAGSFVSSPRDTAPKRIQQLHINEPPQSAFSRRSRELHDQGNLPGRRLPGMRHAFQYGLPIVSTTLTTTWTRTLAKVAPYVSPNYPAAQGFAALRNAVSGHIARTRGVTCTPDDILIVGGVQQAVALTARVLLDPDDVVVMEEPQYFGTRRVLQLHGARVTGVPVDHGGLCVDRLPAHSKLVCVTPSHQFPTGAVLSLPRRRALLEHASRCRSWIMEDDYDGEFRRDARALPALQSMDDDGRVIYVGSFSKTLFPALRIGYVVMPRGLREDFIAAKWAADFGSPVLEQAALARLITHGSYERHLRYVNRKLAERRGVLLDALRDACGDRLETLPSNAGMHVFTWIRDMNAAEGDSLIRHAQAQKLLLYSVAPCYLRPPDRAGLLMGYGAMSTKEIRAAVKLFAACLDAFQRRESSMQGRPRPELARYA